MRVQVIFSSLYQQVVPFTRDYNEIRTALGKLEEFNKTCVDVALSGVDQLLYDEWGCTSHCQVNILIAVFFLLCLFFLVIFLAVNLVTCVNGVVIY